MARSKRRKAKQAAIEKTRRQHSASRWYLTEAKFAGSCGRCDKNHEKGEGILYRHTPKGICCMKCGAALDYRVSTRWQERERARKRKLGRYEGSPSKGALKAEAKSSQRTREFWAREEERRRRWQEESTPVDPKHSAPTSHELRLLRQLGHTDRPRTQHDARVLIDRLLADVQTIADLDAELDEAVEAG